MRSGDEASPRGALRIEDYDFELPASRIAQRPVEPRDSSRLLVCRAPGRLGEFRGPFAYEDAVFRDIAGDAPWALGPGDLLVTNDAKVLPVRLLGHREGGKGAVEALLLRRNAPLEWSALLHMSARARPGLRLLFEPGLIAEILSTHEERLANDGEVRVRFSGFAVEGAPGASGAKSDPEARLERWLERNGHVPLPPYIERADTAEDRAAYQTVYAARSGSAAAPTAGFHFTTELLSQLGAARGVARAAITLDVGLGTFRPIKTERVEDHVMHEERFEIGESFIAALASARAARRRLVAVGTTVVRALESWAVQCAEKGIEPGSPRSAGSFTTRAFIHPGYRFRLVDDLITNFHLPRSTLLVLVSAAMGPDGVAAARAAYAHALAGEYRFFSYGDAMFIRGAES